MGNQLQISAISLGKNQEFPAQTVKSSAKIEGGGELKHVTVWQAHSTVRAETVGTWG